MNALSDYLMKSGREEAGVLLGAYDVTAMIAGQIGQLAPMDEETADLFKQLAKKMMKGIE